MTIEYLIDKWRKRGVLIGNGFVVSLERPLSDKEKAELVGDIKELSNESF